MTGSPSPAAQPEHKLLPASYPGYRCSCGFYTHNFEKYEWHRTGRTTPAEPNEVQTNFCTCTHHWKMHQPNPKADWYCSVQNCDCGAYEQVVAVALSSQPPAGPTVCGTEDETFPGAAAGGTVAEIEAKVYARTVGHCGICGLRPYQHTCDQAFEAMKAHIASERLAAVEATMGEMLIEMYRLFDGNTGEGLWEFYDKWHAALADYKRSSDRKAAA